MLRRNREIVGEWAVGVWEYTDSWLKLPIGASPGIEYKRSKIVLIHIYCAQVGVNRGKIVEVCCAVSNRESQYRRGYRD